MKTALYRFHDATGRLLYVGITKNPPARLGQHGDDKDWWNQVHNIVVTWHPARQAALVAEKEAIRAEHPLYNVQHNGPVRKKTKPAQEIIWLCDGCRKQVRESGPDRGYIHISYVEIYEYRGQREVDRKAREGRMTIRASEISVRARPGWHVHHERCDPNPDANDYWMSIDQWSSPRKITESTAHLLEKNWIRDTDMSDFLRRVARLIP